MVGPWASSEVFLTIQNDTNITVSQNNAETNGGGVYVSAAIYVNIPVPCGHLNTPPENFLGVNYLAIPHSNQQIWNAIAPKPSKFPFLSHMLNTAT